MGVFFVFFFSFKKKRTEKKMFDKDSKLRVLLIFLSSLLRTKQSVWVGLVGKRE